MSGPPRLSDARKLSVILVFPLAFFVTMILIWIGPNRYLINATTDQDGHVVVTMVHP